MSRRLKHNAEDEFNRWIAEGRVDRTGYSFSGSDPEDVAEPDSAEPSLPREIMAEAVDHLQGRQAKVYVLVMRYAYSLADVADELAITKSTAQTYLDRAIAFVTAYCQEAIARGRV